MVSFLAEASQKTQLAPTARAPSFVSTAAGVGFALDRPAQFAEGGYATIHLKLPQASFYAIKLDITITLPTGTSHYERTLNFSASTTTYSFGLSLPQDAAPGDGAVKIVLSRLDGGAVDVTRNTLTGSISNDDSRDFSIDTSDLAISFRNIAGLNVTPDQKFLSVLGDHSVRDDIQALSRLVIDTTSVVVTSYQFFAGWMPSLAGIGYFVDPAKNPNSLNSPYYETFNTENRFINFAANVGLHGDGKKVFAQKYGELSFHDALTQAYQEIVGTVRADAIAGIEAALPYFRQIARERMANADQDLATKAAAFGYLLQEAVRSNTGIYARALENFYLDLSDGSAQHTNLVGVYGSGSFVDAIA